MKQTNFTIHLAIIISVFFIGCTANLGKKISKGSGSIKNVHSNLISENSEFSYSDYYNALLSQNFPPNAEFKKIILDNNKILYECLKNGICGLPKLKRINKNIIYCGTCYQSKGRMIFYRRAVFCIYTSDNIKWDVVFAFSKKRNQFKFFFLKAPKFMNNCVIVTPK